MKRRFRLTNSSDIQRVRRLGKSYAHPLIVLIAMPNDTATTRFAVIAGRSVGGAVKRNCARRLIREAVRPRIPVIVPGWDVLLLARKPMSDTNLRQVGKAVDHLLERSRLMDVVHE